jgi:hypothetical protein
VFNVPVRRWLHLFYAFVETGFNHPVENHQHRIVAAKSEIRSNIIEVLAFLSQFFICLSITGCILDEWIESYLTLLEVLPLPLQVSQQNNTKIEPKDKIWTLRHVDPTHKPNWTEMSENLLWISVVSCQWQVWLQLLTNIEKLANKQQFFHELFLAHFPFELWQKN